MDKSEPALVPQWLRSNGSVTGSGTSIHPLASSLLRLDDHGAPKVSRKNSLGNNDHHLGRSFVSDRTTSSYFRRSSSSNSSAYSRMPSSSSRNHRDRDWDSDLFESHNKDKSILGDIRRRDHSDSLGNKSLNRDEREGIRRSQAIISDRRGETWFRKAGAEPTTTYKNNSKDGNRMPDKGLLHKASFARDFPSLGAEEKQAASEIGRLPSPGLSPGIHSLPVGASSMTGSDKWTSALAEVPGMIGSSGTGISSSKAAGPSSSSASSSIPTGLNMAETVAQGIPRVQTTPQLSTETQRQELAIKQSRQLIPMTPSLPKALVSNTSDKLKTKVGQPQLIHSPRDGSGKPDLPKTSNLGKLKVLKPVWERNCVSSAAKDSLSPKSGSEVSNSAPAVAQLVAGSSIGRSPNNSGLPAAERKLVFPLLEKRPTNQAQSRNDFFNLMRKKSVGVSSSSADLGPETSLCNKSGEGEGSTSPGTHQSGEDVVSGNLNGVATPKSSDAKAGNGESCNGLGHLTNKKNSLSCDLNFFSEEEEDAFLSGEDVVSNNLNGVEIPKNNDEKAGNGESCNGLGHLTNKKNSSSCDLNVFSEEEEAAFLRSLGWEENDEEGGLTDEEIHAFYRDVTHKYVNSKPSLRILQGMPRFLLALDSQIGGIAGISSGLNSSSSKLES